MASNLILYNGPTSPFGRKCKIVANILQIPHEEKIINVYQSDFLDSLNPLRQIPTLVADGQVIADSDNICLYFDKISSQNSLYPSERYWDCLSFINVANGIMENGVNRYIEISAIDKKDQREKAVLRFEKKIIRSINWIGENFHNINLNTLSMDLISIACALDYTNFRFSNDWKNQNSNLYDWYEKVCEEKFMKESNPGVSFKYE